MALEQPSRREERSAPFIGGPQPRSEPKAQVSGTPHGGTWDRLRNRSDAPLGCLRRRSRALGCQGWMPIWAPLLPAAAAWPSCVTSLSPRVFNSTV